MHDADTVTHPHTYICICVFCNINMKHNFSFYIYNVHYHHYYIRKARKKQKQANASTLFLLASGFLPVDCVFLVLLFLLHEYFKNVIEYKIPAILILFSLHSSFMKLWKTLEFYFAIYGSFRGQNLLYLNSNFPLRFIILNAVVVVMFLSFFIKLHTSKLVLVMLKYR